MERRGAGAGDGGGCRATVVYRTEGFTGECMCRNPAK